MNLNLLKNGNKKSCRLIKENNGGESFTFKPDLKAILLKQSKNYLQTKRQSQMIY